MFIETEITKVMSAETCCSVVEHINARILSLREGIERHPILKESYTGQIEGLEKARWLISLYSDATLQFEDLEFQSSPSDSKDAGSESSGAPASSVGKPYTWEEIRQK